MAGGEGGQGAAQRARLLQPAGKEGENELALAPPALPLAYEAVGAGEGDDGGARAAAPNLTDRKSVV